MLTKKDVNLLEEKFVTKQEYRNSIDELVELVKDGFSSLEGKINEILTEVRGHRVIFGNHEERLRNLEKNISP